MALPAAIIKYRTPIKSTEIEGHAEEEIKSAQQTYKYAKTNYAIEVVARGSTQREYAVAERD